MSAPISIWSVTYLLHSTLLIGIIWLAARWIRSASVRDTLWKVALCGGILTATLQSAVPIDAVVPQAAPAHLTFDRTVFESVAPALVQAPTAPTRSLPSRESLAFGAWTLIALALLARILIGHARFLAAVGQRTELVAGPERERLDRLCVRAGVRRAVRLTQSQTLASPVAMLGWEIVIPAVAFDRLSEEQRETILAHELAHLVRRDPLWLTLGELIKAVLFFQPLNWMVQAKAKETAEFLCDDAAVLQTGQPKALAETLAELAAYPVPTPPAVAAMAEGGSNLMARVTRVLQSNPVAPLKLGARLVIALAMVAVMALFAPGMVAAVDWMTIDGGVTRFSDGVLTQAFLGPEGQTNVVFKAHEAEVAINGSFVRLLKKKGWVRATQTSERGPRREVEIVQGRNEPAYRYVVDGVEKPWCDDARLVLVASFIPQFAYPETVRMMHTTRRRKAPKPRAANSGAAEWRTTLEISALVDGLPKYLSVNASGIMVDYDSGEIDLKPGAHLDVAERHGSFKRSFHMDEREKTFDGAFEDDEKRPWLTNILRRQSDLPDNVIETLAR